MNLVPSLSVVPLDLVKRLTKTSNAVIVFMFAVTRPSATNTIKLHVHQRVTICLLSFEHRHGAILFI